MSTVPSAKSAWQPQIPVNQSIYEVNTTQQAPLGTRLEVGDRVFYYSSVSASQARGTVLCSLSPTASHNGALCTFAATSAGVKIVTITAGVAMTANQYAEGYLGVSKGTMGGCTYRVKSHASIGSGATGTITLYDDLVDDVAAADECGFIHNIYKEVAVASSALGFPVCIPMVNVTAGAYFWGQTFGPAAPLNQAATPAGAAIKMGTTGGVLQAFNAGTTGPAAACLPIGKNYNLAGTAGEYTPVFLSVRP